MSLPIMKRKLHRASLFSLLSALVVQPAMSAETSAMASSMNLGEIASDQPGQIDNATSLGRELSVSLQHITEETTKLNEQSSAPAKARTAEGALPSENLPPVAAPAAARAPRRSAPESIAPAGVLATPVYTPDFSRQKMSFGQLIGKKTVDLPNSNAALEQPKIAKDTNALASEAWSLTDIVNEGLVFSPVFKRAQAQFDTAEARKNQARADLLPTLSTSMKSGGAKVEMDDYDNRETGNYRTSLTRLIQPIYNQTYYSNLSSARLGKQSAEYRIVAAREAVILSLVQATSSLAAARVIIGFADEQEAQLNDVFRYLETRAQAGASSSADLERARTRVLAARQNRIELQANYKSALYEVERLLGEAPKALNLPYLNQLPSLPQTKEDLRRLMEEHNAGLKALKMDIEAQEAQVTAEYGKLMPSVALSLEHDMQRNVDGPSAKQTDKRIVLTMNWAVSLGGKEIYGAQEAKAGLRSNETKYQEERKRLDQMLDANFAMLQSTTQRIATGESEQQAAEKVVDAVGEQLKLGRIGSLLDALDAFDRLFAARNRQVNALSQQIIAQAQLLSMIGMLSQMTSGVPLQPEPLQQTNIPNNGQLSSLNRS